MCGNFYIKRFNNLFRKRPKLDIEFFITCLFNTNYLGNYIYMRSCLFKFLFGAVN